MTVRHTINGCFVGKLAAIDRANENCATFLPLSRSTHTPSLICHAGSTTYRISRSTQSQARIWANLHAVQERQFTLTLPAGISQDDMDARLAGVDYGAGLGLKLEPSAVPEDAGQPRAERTASRFAQANRRVQHLRRLAQAGKADLQREEELGARPIVWGKDADDGSLRRADRVNGRDGRD